MEHVIYLSFAYCCENTFTGWTDRRLDIEEAFQEYKECTGQVSGVEYGYH